MIGTPARGETSPRLTHQRRVSHAVDENSHPGPPTPTPTASATITATATATAIASPVETKRSSMESSPKALRALSIKEEKRREKRENSCTDAVSTGSGSATGSLAGVPGVSPGAGPAACPEGEEIEDGPGHGHGPHHHGPGHPKAHKFISNWRHACDKTRDRTRDLLKRWRTAPDGEAAVSEDGDSRLRSGSGTSGTRDKDSDTGERKAEQGHGWSVHIWATWVKRLPSDEEGFLGEPREATGTALLSPLQRDKFTQFFNHLIDNDRDEIVSAHDFEVFSERLRHFADWSNNSGEFHVLRQVERGFVSVFVDANPEGDDPEVEPFMLGGEPMCSLDQWLSRWGNLVGKSRTYRDIPIWLHYFARIMFQVINKSGSGIISRDELSAYYSSVVGLGAQRVGEILDEAYKALTANGDHPLTFSAYRLSFANFLLGRSRNGPGQFLFGPGEPANIRSSPFPIDYSAMNTPVEELEHYSPDRKTNRRSVVV